MAILEIPPSEARYLEIASGTLFSIVDVEGGQVGDLFIFDLNDFTTYASAEHTRAQTGRLFPIVGENLWSNRREPIVRFVEDTSLGRHDSLYAACDSERYRLLGASPSHRSCRENLLTIEHKLGYQNPISPQPFNLFMDVSVGSDEKLNVTTASSLPGSLVRFEALIDVLVILSSCPMDIVPISTIPLSSLRIETN